MFLIASAAAFAAIPVTAFAPASVALVNGTGGPIRSIEIRKAATASWSAGPTVTADGARTAWTFDSDDCAYDLRATMASGEVLSFMGVNPCDARMLTLRRNGGAGWVDYD
jgi:hypothetical protein